MRSIYRVPITLHVAFSMIVYENNILNRPTYNIRNGNAKRIGILGNGLICHSEDC